MSKLLIDEPPLQVLPSLAILIGLNESIFLQQLHWLTKDLKSDIEGKRWLRRTYSQWKDKHFPFWSIRTLERVVSKLSSEGLILTEQRDKKTRNRDNYYAVDYDGLARKQGKLDGGIEPAKMAVSEGDRLAGSDDDKVAGSYKDQISQTNTNQDQTPRMRAQGIVKPKPPHDPNQDLNADARRELLGFLIERIGPLANAGAQAGAVNWMFERAYSSDQCIRCFEYLFKQEWRGTAVTWLTVKKEIGAWHAKGEPDQNGNGSNGKRQSDYETASQRDLRLIREGIEKRRVPGSLTLNHRQGPTGQLPPATGAGGSGSHD